MEKIEQIEDKNYSLEKIKQLKKVLVGFWRQQTTRTLDEITNAIILVGIAENKEQALNEIKYLENNSRGYGTPYYKNFPKGKGLLFAVHKRPDGRYQVGKTEYYFPESEIVPENFGMVCYEDPDDMAMRNIYGKDFKKCLGLEDE